VTAAVRQTRGAETSLAKAIRLLPIVAERNASGVNLSTIARKAGLTPATARRLLQGLVDGGLLSFDPYSKIYTLGIGLFDLAGAPASPRQFDGLRLRLRSAVEETAAVTGDTVYVTVPHGDEALCIDTASGADPISTNTLHVGSRRPLGVGAGSAALLSALPEERRERVIAAHREAYGRYGALSPAGVRAMVAHWQRHRYVVNHSVIIPDVGAVAVAVFDETHRLIAGLSVSALKSRLTPARCETVVGAMTAALIRTGFKT
jgi:DNA-binding IclR family transcriptional regulator